MHAACASLPLDSSWQRSTAASSITRSVQHCVPADCWLAYLLHQQQAHTQSHVIIHPLQHNLGVGHQAAGRRKLWGRRHGRASQGGSASGCCQSSGGAAKQLRLHCSGQVPGNPHLICISTAPRSSLLLAASMHSSAACRVCSTGLQPDNAVADTRRSVAKAAGCSYTRFVIAQDAACLPARPHLLDLIILAFQLLQWVIPCPPMAHSSSALRVATILLHLHAAHSTARRQAAERRATGVP